MDDEGNSCMRRLSAHFAGSGPVDARFQRGNAMSNRVTGNPVVISLDGGDSSVASVTDATPRGPALCELQSYSPFGRFVRRLSAATRETLSVIWGNSWCPLLLPLIPRGTTRKGYGDLIISKYPHVSQHELSQKLLAPPSF